MTDTSNKANNEKQGVISRTVGLIFLLISTYIGSLVLSILLEWVGIFFDWWDQPGILHSKISLETELHWLNGDFKQIMVPPVSVALYSLELMYEFIIQATGFEWVIQQLKGTPFHDYFLAAAYVMELNAVRLAVIIMSLPALLMFGIYALIDGLSERDVRTWSGGHETSYVYHHAKSWIKPFFMLPIVIYLSSPWSIHPSIFILVFALPFSYAIWLTALYFKKYL